MYSFWRLSLFSVHQNAQFVHLYSVNRAYVHFLLQLRCCRLLTDGRALLGELLGHVVSC